MSGRGHLCFWLIQGVSVEGGYNLEADLEEYSSGKHGQEACAS